MSCEELSPAHKASEAKASSDASSPADSLITDQQLRRTPSSHSRAEGSFRARASHSTHVLLVESDPDQREPLEALLGKWGYRVDFRRLWNSRYRACADATSVNRLARSETAGYERVPARCYA